MTDFDFNEESENAFELIIENQDILTDYSDQIKEIFRENFRVLETRIQRSSLVGGVSGALAIAIDDSETQRELGNILVWLTSLDINPIPVLEERGASDDLLRLIATLRNRHHLEIQDLEDTSEQGENHWKRIHSDWVIRGSSGVPGMNHQIYLAGDEEIRISTSLNSNLDLINILLEKQIAATNSFGEVAREHQDTEYIERLEDLTEKLKDAHEIGANEDN